MNAFWTTDNLCRTLGGHWLVPPAQEKENLAGLSIDSRALQPRQVFLALAGDKFDGHDFVSQAVAGRAGMMIVHRPVKEIAQGSVPVLLVENTLNALQQLAKAYRDFLASRNVRVIAVVGSNGKTTTRHLIHSVLSSRLRGTQSPKSFNNHIGVPLTLLGSNLDGGEKDDDFVVVEIGTNHPGEIEALSRIVRPDAMVLSSLGREHMEFFHTLDNVAAEECSIFPYLSATGLAVLPGDDETGKLIQRHLASLPATVKIQYVGETEKANARLLKCENTLEGQKVRASVLGDECELMLPLLGKHNAMNALAAGLVGRRMNLSTAEVVDALAKSQPAPMRGQIQTIGGWTILNDAYNANPDSVGASLEIISQIAPATGPWVLVLGDMLELGNQGPDLHRQIGKRLSAMAAQAKLVVLMGSLSLFTAQAMLKHGFPPEQLLTISAWEGPATAKQIISRLVPGDRIFLKASRSMGLERLLTAMQEYVSQGAGAGDASANGCCSSCHSMNP